MNSLNVLAVGDSIIEADADGGLGWCGRVARRAAERRGAELSFHNGGIGGQTSADVLSRIERELEREQRWDSVIVGVGVNDSRKEGPRPLRRQIEPPDFLSNIEGICQSVLRGCGDARIFFAGFVPVVEELTCPIGEEHYYRLADCLAYQALLEAQLSKHASIRFIDFSTEWFALPREDRSPLTSDGLHPSVAGHQFLATVAWRVMRDSV